MDAVSQTVIVRDLGLQDYLHVWKAMRQLTDNRNEHTPDEFWCVQHPPVFTQGQAGQGTRVWSLREDAPHQRRCSEGLCIGC